MKEVLSPPSPLAPAASTLAVKPALEAASRTWLFVDGATAFGGHEVMLLRMVEELKEGRRVDVGLMAREGTRLAFSTPGGARASTLAPLLSGALAPWRQLLTDARAIRRELRRLGAGVCIFASGSLGDQVALAIALAITGQRVVVYVPLMETFAAMGYRVARMKDLFVRHVYARLPIEWISISHLQAEQFKAWAKPKGMVHVLPNTVARAIEQAPRLPLRAVAAGQALRVLVLGRLDAKQKGLDLLVAQLQQEPDARLSQLTVHFVGEGPYRDALAAACAADPRLAGSVRLAPWCEARQAMADADVLLLPSRFEGVPLVMLEAMALGLPVVASSLPGTRGYLPDECLFPVGDLATAIDRVLALRPIERRLALADQGRATYDRSASASAFTRNVEALVSSVSGVS